MSKQRELTKRDQELLKKIGEILANGGGEMREVDSLYGFCAHLASTVPRADDTFREQLGSRLVTKLEGQQEKKTMNTEKSKQGFMSRLFPRKPRWRPVFMGAVIVVLLASALLAVFPGMRTATAQAVGELRRLLSAEIRGGPDGVRTFEPRPPFTVKQPDYIPDGFQHALASYQAGPVQPSTQGDRATLAHVVLRYEARDGRYFQLFERAVQPGEVLPDGVPRTVGRRTAVLQGEDEMRWLTWIDDGTWIELKGTLSEAELLKIAAALITTQTPIQDTQTVEGNAPAVTARQIPQVTLEEAQAQVPFHIPVFTWLPPGLELGGAHVSPPDWAHIYYKPTPSSPYPSEAGIGLAVTRGEDPAQIDIDGTQRRGDIMVNGQPARYWAGESRGMLRWEADGFSYTLTYSGLDLDREDVKRLAESLE